MTGEIKHIGVGVGLSQEEYEATGAHTFLMPMTTYTATQTLDDTVVGVICNKETAMTINLPAASGGGRIYYIKNIGAGEVTVDGNSTDLIDGVETQSLLQWFAITIVDYAANKWVII
jgi:hypothetical protein